MSELFGGDCENVIPGPDCVDHHQAGATVSAGRFQPRDLVGTNVGPTLWSDGGPSRAFQFFEVTDERMPGLVCPGYV